MPASSSARVPGFDRLPLSFPLLLVYAAGLMPGVLLPLKCRADASAEAEMQRQGMGGSSVWESQTGSLLVDYYETFLRERDLDRFREQVTALYGRDIGACADLVPQRGRAKGRGSGPRSRRQLRPEQCLPW